MSLFQLLFVAAGLFHHKPLIEWGTSDLATSTISCDNGQSESFPAATSFSLLLKVKQGGKLGAFCVIFATSVETGETVTGFAAVSGTINE